MAMTDKNADTKVDVKLETTIAQQQSKPSEAVLAHLDDLLPDVEALYTDLHAHPELSMQAPRTAGVAADRLRAAGYDVTSGIGKTGVVGLLRNGEGPTVMLRADRDALPVQEATGLPYASTVTATDHDGTTWRGTLLAVFQPAEETGTGAQAMIDDGLFDRFPKPDVVLGQHVMAMPAGTLNRRAGVITSASDSLQIRLFGRGAHGSMPQASIDPVVLAAATLLRLQTIVSREVAPTESAVVTVGALQAGTAVNVRTFDAGVRTRVLAAIERIVKAEAEASGAPKPPNITSLGRAAAAMNDPEATTRVDAFRRHFPAERVQHTDPRSASEDFGSFGTEWHVPSVFWFVGGTDADWYAKAKAAGRLNEIPTNHNPRFAPLIHPTLETGVEAAVVAAHAWLSA